MIDYIIIGILVFSLLVSLWRGFVREVLSLVGWVAAFLIANHFYPYVSTLLLQLNSSYLQHDTLRNSIAAAMLFILVLIVSGIVNTLLGHLVDKTGLSGTDRILGAGFGLLRGIFVVAALLFFLERFTGFAQSQWWQESQLIPHFDFIAKWFFEQLQIGTDLLPAPPQPSLPAAQP